MPSLLLSAASGSPFPIVSGGFFSGDVYPSPYATMNLRLDRSASGSAYICLSGGCTINSGGFYQSGGGALDGYQLGPGQEMIIPRLVFLSVSGFVPIYAGCDAACSGQARLYYQNY